ncbi:glycosyltransferase [Flavobacteriaceae bacterium SZ-1-7]|uniref:glycosyltransferase n=1 Tax=Tamlana sedimenti TaxID=3134126 RepID=UPI00312A803F
MSKKICLLVDSLSGGGAERVAANMSVSLSRKGYKVHLVSMKDEITYAFEGELFNFGKVKSKTSKINAFKAFKFFFESQNFDLIIDHRVRSVFLKELIFSKIVFKNSKVIYCIHNYKLSYAFSYVKWPWLAKLPLVKNNKFVCVCNEIKNHLHKTLGIQGYVIYNYFTKKGLNPDVEKIDLNENYIIGVGRLTKIKQFNKLIAAYSNSKLHEANIKLFILGDGDKKAFLEKQVAELKLGDFVKLMPFKKNPYPLIGKAKALVMSSKAEGFPMVLLEALTLKTPVIAFDCKSGPKEIIKNEINGILVEDQNESQLTLALNKLLESSFYENLKMNTHVGLEKFSEEKIVQDWINLLENQR